MPRKNAKSALGSALALDKFIFGGRGVDVYNAAAEKEQARIVFNETKQIIKANPELDELCNPLKDVIELPSMNSILRVLSAEAYSKEGLNVSMAIVDELHAHPDDKLWNVLTLASGARVDPLVVAITTAGVKRDSSGYDSICYKLYQYGKRLASGEIEDPSFFFAWWQAPDGSDWQDPEAWRIANPGYGDLVDPEDLAAKAKPGKMREEDFKTKRMNMFVESMNAWFPEGVFESRTHTGRTIEPGTRVVLGFDGSRSGDATALVAVTVEEQPFLDVLGLWERPEDARDDYQVPRAPVLDAIRQACLTYDVAEVSVDMYLWQTEMQDLEAEGIPIVAINQGGTAMVNGTQRFYEAVMTGTMSHSGHLGLMRHVGNAVIKKTTSGDKLAKDSKGSPRKIDAAVAAVMAFNRALDPSIADGGSHVW